MNIQDRATNRPKLFNTSRAFVWEVITKQWDDNSEDTYDKIEAVFFDPWNAVQYGTSHFGVNFIVQLSLRKI